MLKYFDISELQETKLPIRLIITTKKWKLVQGHEITPLRVKGDIGDVCSELDNGGIDWWNINVALFSYIRAFGDGPDNFEPWSSDVDDT
ncbi:hypothetical protein TNCV_4319551 [Trichonephila clavipes]|nr:hypothetical protein TNCV_4319551 [Trichonephila clavipes]